MKKIDIFYSKLKKDDALREEFISALANGSLLDFFISL